MKRILLPFLILIQFCFINALVVHLQSWNLKEDISTLNKLGLDIDSVSEMRSSITVYLRGTEEYDLLKASGFDPVILPDPYEVFLAETAKNPAAKGSYQYYSLDNYITFMQNTAAAYPEICQLHEWGRSVQNRPLLALKISDNVAQSEPEPQVKLISTIHGDEPVGYDLLIRLIKLLTEEYSTNPRIINIVNNTELWIVPLMNPDGYVNHTRYNAQGRDLNRNFPMPYPGLENPDGHPLAPENSALMDFSLPKNFVLGFNLHGGALVINYPWDYTYTLAPDDALLIDLSLTYAMHNPPMYNSNEFNQGITNGAAWYPITGSMQDWNYYYTSNIELTAEIGYNKWPAASTLDSYWQDNKESILSYIEYAQKGVKGTVYSSHGVPLEASITVDGAGSLCFSGAELGDYHRILLPGTYTISASAFGYIPQSAEVTVPPEGHVVQNFTLQAAESLNIAGTKRDLAGNALMGEIDLYLDKGLCELYQVGGNWQLNEIYEGDYRLDAFSNEACLTADISLRENTLNEPHALIFPEVLVSDNFDAGMDKWQSTGTWGIESFAGEYTLSDSPNGNYANNANTYARLAQALDLSDITEPSLSFRAFWDLEINYDYVYLEVSHNGASWQELDRFTGTMQHQDLTELYTYDLSDYSGGNLHLRFRLKSDRTNRADGIKIAGLKICGYPANQSIYGDFNHDKLVSRKDIELLLDHLCTEPLPAEMLAFADLNNDGQINAVDAALIYLYCVDAGFRFPLQSGESYALPPVNTEVFVQGNNLLITCDNPEELYSIELHSSGLNWQTPELAAASYIKKENAHTGVLAIIGQDFPAQLVFSFDASPIDTDLEIYLNGYALEIPSVENASEIAPQHSFHLAQNYPNPFNPSTMFSFRLPMATAVSLDVYNLKGQKVANVLSGNYPAGKHQFAWEAKDNSGQTLGNGLYFYVLNSGRQRLVRKMVLSK